MTSSLVLEDTVEDNLRRVVLDINVHQFVQYAKCRPECQSHTDYTVNWTLLFGTGDFLQAVDVYPAQHPDEASERSFDDFFSGEGDDSEPVQEGGRTAILLHPYGEREQLSERTGREYLSEQEDCIEFLKDLADEASA